MGDKRNFAALDWVIGEISDTLKEARQSLEAYVEDPKDSTRIRFCLTHIHQVYGSLQMVEFHGASLLAEEMEHTAQAVMDNTVASIPEAQEVLMRSLLQLPIYLEHIKNKKEDNPTRVMPLLNDLRAVRKQSYLSETNLFSPDLSVAKTPSGAKHPVVNDPEKLAQVVKKLREMYQFAAASVLRGIKVEDNLRYLDKVFSRLELLTAGTHCHPIWEVSAALVDALQRDELELTVAVRGLLRYIARELRILGEKAPAALNIAPREPLLKNLLYYVARAADGSEKVATVKEKYKLASALLGSSDQPENYVDDMLQAPDADAIRSVVVALQDEIGSIKHTLDLSLSGKCSNADLKEILPTAKRVADTLAVLGIGNLRKEMLEQSERLEKISEASSFDENELMQTASKIIEIEHRLRAIAKSAGKNVDLSKVDEREVEIDNAKAAVLRECVAGLSKSKDSIIDYISSQWEKEHLVNVGSTLTDVRGGLAMIPLPRAATIVASCGQFVQEQLVEGTEHPSVETLGTLADAIVGVEYHLERLMEDVQEDVDTTLDIAEESIVNLGYKIEPMEVVAAAKPAQQAASDIAPVEPPSVEIPAPVVSIDEPAIDVAQTRDTESEQALVQEPLVEEVSPGTDVEVPAVVASVEETIPEDSILEDTTPEDSTPEDISPELNVAQAPEAPKTPDVPPVPGIDSNEDVAAAQEDESESFIDDEIIEIFIEEATEVLETLAEYFPQWKEKESDQDALVVIRRAFHTLKGSGRMVEAFDIGELAWSVESMLNRIIDRTITIQPHIFHLIEAVIAIVPTLVKAFENRKPNPQKALTSQYEAWGQQISDGNPPDELAEPIPLFSEEAVAETAVPAEKVPEEQAPVSITDVAPAFEPSADSEFIKPEQTAEIEQASTQDVDDSDEEVDQVLQEIFSQESITHLGTIEGFIKEMEYEAPIYAVPSDALQRALHTLKGSAKMAQVWPIAEITEPLENFAKELIAFQVRVNEDILQLIRDAAQYIRNSVTQIDEGRQAEIPQIPQFTARTQELRDLAVGHLVLPKGQDTSELKVDPRMLSLVMAEEMALLLEADKHIRQWGQSGQRSDEIDSLVEELSVLETGASQANLPDMCCLAASLREAHTKAQAAAELADEEFFLVMQQGHESLLDMVDAVAAGQNVQAPPQALSDSLARILLREAPTAVEEESAVAEEESVVVEGEDEASSGLEFDLSTLEEIEVNAEDESLIPEAEPVIPEESDTAETAISFDLSSLDDAEEVSFDAGEQIEAEEISFDFGAGTDVESEGEISFEALPEDQITEEPEEGSALSFDMSELAGADIDEQSTAEEITVDEVTADEVTVGEITADEITVDEITVDEITADEITADEITVQDNSGEENQIEDHTDLGDTGGDVADTEIAFEEPESTEPEDVVFENIDSDNIALEELNLESEGDITLEFEAENAESSADVINLDESESAEISFEVSDDITLTEETPSELGEYLIPEDEDLVGEDVSEETRDELNLADELDLEEIQASDLGEPQEALAPEETLAAPETPAAQDTEGAPAFDSSIPVIPGLLDAIDTNSDDFDRDILEVFLEEADELVEGMDEAIHAWESNWSDVASVEEIKRILHTMKGGARLSGLNILGDLTHDYESSLIDMGEDLSTVDEAFFANVHGYQDRVHNAVRGVKAFLDSGYEIAQGEPVGGVAVDEPTVDEPVAVVVDEAVVGQENVGQENVGQASTDEENVGEQGVAQSSSDIESDVVEPEIIESEGDSEQLAEEDLNEPETENTAEAGAEALDPGQASSTEASSTEDSSTNVVKFAPKPKGADVEEFAMPAISGGGGSPAQPQAAVALKKAGPQEVVKISAELLEELVNLAGETSINRSRLEQYVNDFSFALDEVDATLNRLQDQLRRLDIETEAQVLFRQEQMEQHDEFDPLEMDRYSHLQQLSRSLIESASDLTDLKADLGDKLRVTETLLLQQSRINTTLQEGLMRSRMVPFSRMVPRLRRIVRQVASELGKNVSFELDNVEGELDRSVLERMVPPFEHMLRNAVDHGIETPEDRIAAGKAESGRIVLTLSREGGDVIIRLADDGRGVDLTRVREKAIERELMGPDADLSDHDIMQFILHAGFSTAENVTQISGRGVGMDVVHAEIKQLGGSMSINSAWGKGTEFTIRLPFTLSVNRALMVAIGQDQYAVPLSSIEGIVRVSPFELEHYYAHPEAQFEYAGENYDVRYLGGLLYNGAAAPLDGHVLPLPVLLVRSAEHAMALQVDAVMGSREIVVKSLGQQFSTVPGLSGATVMGDGSVVVILDPHALVRQEIARATLQLEGDEGDYQNEEEELLRVKKIMVVDDSVTVRKVTTRFLEREGFEVVTAKDGVDALRLLQEGLPDLMLLDIEMPRMDGFEVAKTVRSTKRWEDLPIIMITSRTGDKHRDHALSLGVNNYLGKPYQEDILHEAIGEILEHDRLRS